MNSQQKRIEESMLAQRGYLEIIRSRHYQWAYATDDPEIRRQHLEIADAIQETMDRYYSIFNTYQSLNESSSPGFPDIFALDPAATSMSQEA